MQEYFNIDVESNLNLGEPQEIHNKKGEAAILSPIYNVGNEIGDNGFSPITIMTPPLRCSRVRVWPGKNNKYSKCVIELETTENEWRFTQFLTDLSGRCRYIITENAKDWFKYAFSASSMRDSYANLFVQKKYKHNEEERIEIQLGKLLLNDLDKQLAKSYRNQYLVLRLVFKGILICKGVFSEIWRADQIFKAKPNINESDESDYDDDYYEDIGEMLTVENNTVKKTKEEKNTNNQEKAKEVKTSVKTKTSKKETVTVEKVDENNEDRAHRVNSENSNQNITSDNQVEEVSEKTIEPSTSSKNERNDRVAITMNVKEASSDKKEAKKEDNPEDENVSKAKETPHPSRTNEKVITRKYKKSNTLKKTKRKKRIIISNNRRRKW